MTEQELTLNSAFDNAPKWKEGDGKYELRLIISENGRGVVIHKHSYDEWTDMVSGLEDVLMDCKDDDEYESTGE